MPLAKKQSSADQSTYSQAVNETIGTLTGTQYCMDKQERPMTKDDYWRRREERDIRRDKDMAWSGMAQAVLNSAGIIQFNADNTVAGLVALVTKVTDLLLNERDKRNS